MINNEVNKKKFNLQGPLGARHANDSTMIGIGLAPEAIDQNYVIYEFMLEHTWIREKRDIDKW